MTRTETATAQPASTPLSPRSWFDRLRGNGPLAVVLFASLPVFFLWSYNVDDEVRPADVGVILALCIGGSLVVFGLLLLAFRASAKAAAGTVLIQVVVFSFGHLINVADVGEREETLIFLCSIALCLAGLIVVSQRAREETVRVLNLIGAILLLINIVPVGRSQAAGSPLSAALDVADIAVDPTAVGEPRDVYYLIFDRYAGEESLEQLYGFSNDAFLDGLRERGFVVVDDALANYPQTAHSLASSLNMTHLTDLSEVVGEGTEDWDPVYRSLGDTTVSRLFQKMGYEYDHIGSWWSGTWVDPAADRNFMFDGVRDFTATFWNTTAIPVLATRLGLVDVDDPYRRLLDRIDFQAAAVGDVSEDPGPTFTFAHFLLPHEPYVVDRDGNFRNFHDLSDGTTIEEAYIDQLLYTNVVIEDLLDQLLAGPPAEDPIIVLQSDEGPHPPELELGETLALPWSDQPVTELQRKLRILNAMYLPGTDDQIAYPGITPVNTFRALFNAYYGTDFEMLDDETFIFVDHDHPFRFESVGQMLRGAS